MAGTYCEFILLQCKMHTITSVCKVVSTKGALLNISKKEFNGCKNIISDSRLYDSLYDCIRDKNIINPNCLNIDSRIVFDRCSDFILSRCIDDYNKLFDILVEINWLLASYYNSKKNGEKEIILLKNYKTRRECLKEYLWNLYNLSVEDYNECNYIAEALEIKGKILSGLHKFKYEESRRYLSQEYDYMYLKELQREYRNISINKRTLFYGLTATAALENDIRRRA